MQQVWQVCCVSGTSSTVFAGKAAAACSPMTWPTANPPPSASSTREECVPTENAAGNTHWQVTLSSQENPTCDKVTRCLQQVCELKVCFKIKPNLDPDVSDTHRNDLWEDYCRPHASVAGYDWLLGDEVSGVCGWARTVREQRRPAELQGKRVIERNFVTADLTEKRQQ